MSGNVLRGYEAGRKEKDSLAMHRTRGGDADDHHDLQGSFNISFTCGHVVKPLTPTQAQDHELLSMIEELSMRIESITKSSGQGI